MNVEKRTKKGAPFDYGYPRAQTLSRNAKSNLKNISQITKKVCSKETKAEKNSDKIIKLKIDETYWGDFTVFVEGGF